MINMDENKEKKGYKIKIHVLVLSRFAFNVDLPN